MLTLSMTQIIDHEVCLTFLHQRLLVYSDKYRKNGDKSKYVYTTYTIAFDGAGLQNLGNEFA